MLSAVFEETSFEYRSEFTVKDMPEIIQCCIF